MDAHELIALCAPRPVFIGAGAPKATVGWTPKGMFLAAVAAGPVYRFWARRIWEPANSRRSRLRSPTATLHSGNIAADTRRARTGRPSSKFASRYLNEPARPK